MSLAIYHINVYTGYRFSGSISPSLSNLSQRGGMLMAKKLGVEVKMPKIEHEGQVHNLDGKRYICDFCGIEFSNGKALGGHRRSHLQKMKDKNESKKEDDESYKRTQNLVVEVQKPKIKNNKIDADDLGCRVCHKDFQSSKSIHVRSHPETDWRGTKPPSPAATNSSPSCSLNTLRQRLDNEAHPIQEDPNLVSNQPKALWSWGATGKRGREAKKTVTSTVLDEHTISNIGAHDLMVLAHGQLPKIGEMKRKKRFSRCKADKKVHRMEKNELVKKNQVQPNPFPLKRRRIEPSMQATDTRRNSSLKKPKYHGENTFSSGTQSFEPSDNGDHATPKKKDNWKSKNPIPINDGDGQIDMSSRFECSICKQRFPSYQALGGHMSRHKRSSMTRQSANECPSPDSSQSVDAKHQCPACGKTFTMGQALGGHKRHCKGPVSLNGSPQEGEEIHQTKPLVFPFDLNELPPAESEETEEIIEVKEAEEHSACLDMKRLLISHVHLTIQQLNYN